MIKIDVNALESEKQSVIMFYKKQIESFRYIKKEAEGVQWADSKYDDFVDSMNIIGEALSQMLQAITNGSDVYVISDILPLANEYLEKLFQTDTYKEYFKNYGDNFISQRVPIAMGISGSGVKTDKLNSPFNLKDKNIALLTGNHDLPTLRQFVDELTDTNNPKLTKAQKKTQKLFHEFCKKELKLSEQEMKNKELIFEKVMEWHYKQDVKQVQTTLSDALGIYYRPNIPGFWNGHQDKFLQKPTPEGLLPFWSKVFPKDFLNRTDKNGINPGYKEEADKFTAMMQKLYPDK